MAGILRRWPALELTEELKETSSYYRTPTKDGTEYHVYQRTLTFTTFANEQSVPSVVFQASGQRTHVFAMAFSGDTPWWSLELVKANNDRLIELAPIAALLNAPVMNPTFGSPGDAYPLGLLVPNPGPLLWDPPIVLQGTDSLRLNGSVPSLLVTPNPDNRTVLHIAFHVWEFPGAPRNVGGGKERKNA